MHAYLRLGSTRDSRACWSVQGMVTALNDGPIFGIPFLTLTVYNLLLQLKHFVYLLDFWGTCHCLLWLTLILCRPLHNCCNTCIKDRLVQRGIVVVRCHRLSVLIIQTRVVSLRFILLRHDPFPSLADFRHWFLHLLSYCGSCGNRDLPTLGICSCRSCLYSSLWLNDLLFTCSI